MLFKAQLFFFNQMLSQKIVSSEPVENVEIFSRDISGPYKMQQTVHPANDDGLTKLVSLKVHEFNNHVTSDSKKPLADKLGSAKAHVEADVDETTVILRPEALLFKFPFFEFLLAPRFADFSYSSGDNNQQGVVQNLKLKGDLKTSKPTKSARDEMAEDTAR